MGFTSVLPLYSAMQVVKKTAGRYTCISTLIYHSKEFWGIDFRSNGKKVMERDQKKRFFAKEASIQIH